MVSFRSFSILSLYLTLLSLANAAYLPLLENVKQEALNSLKSLNLPVPPGNNKPVPGGSPLQVCNSNEFQLLDLEKVLLDPIPPVRGENLTISAIGNLNTEIVAGAYVDIVVTWGYVQLIKQTYDLCEELPNVDMECPLKKGHYELTKEVEIPEQVPPGKYTVIAKAYTEDDELITCLTGSVEFPKY